MLKINTADIDEKWLAFQNDDVVAQAYNGLDCCVTFEIFETLKNEIEKDDPDVLKTYCQSLRKHGPVMEMALRGIAVNTAAKEASLRQFQTTLNKLQLNFDRLCIGSFDQKFNWRSPMQMKILFYSILGLKEIKKRDANGNFSATVNREALERFQMHLYAQVFSRHILAMRDLGKKIGFLRTALDDDNRLRTSYNIAGTNTGRLSSSTSVFETGTNNQNIDTTLRFPFVADPGMYFLNIDLEQSDARNVGARIWEIYVDSHGPAAAGKYLDACESGDLHTTVCSMAWQELPWPDPWNLKDAKAVAGEIFYRDMTYRDGSKRLGHGTNFYGTPRTMAKHTKTETSVIESFQRRYFDAFPLIGSFEKDHTKDNWHNWVRHQLAEYGFLKTLYGRRRFFFGRVKDDTTLREAIAYEPQSMTAHSIDEGYTQVWEALPQVQLEAQVHDSILLQIPFSQLEILQPQIMELMKYEITLKHGRRFSVPLECKGGWNWGDVKFNKQGGVSGNPHGLLKWTGSELRKPPSPTNRLKDYLK